MRVTCFRTPWTRRGKKVVKRVKCWKVMEEIVYQVIAKDTGIENQSQALCASLLWATRLIDDVKHTKSVKILLFTLVQQPTCDYSTTKFQELVNLLQLQSTTPSLARNCKHESLNSDSKSKVKVIYNSQQTLPSKGEFKICVDSHQSGKWFHHPSSGLRHRGESYGYLPFSHPTSSPPWQHVA